MVKKLHPPLLDRPASVMRIFVDESAPNTLTERVFATPVSAAARLVMRIWQIYLDCELPDPGLPTGATAVFSTFLDVGLSVRQGMASVPTWRNPGCLINAANIHTTSEEVTAAGVGIGCAFGSKGPGGQLGAMVQYPGGMLIADELLSLYIVGVGNTVAHFADGIIWYTLEQISPEDYFALLSVRGQ